MGVSILLIALGGSVGAIGRFIVANVVKRCSSSRFPKATLLVNGVGSLLLGLLVGRGAEENVMFFFGIGVCGAFTTFSTLNWEILRLLQENTKMGLFYFFASYLIGVVLGAAGYAMGMAL
ncbi:MULTISPECIES: CrcB family protein [unclassified Rossellomorea]|uniref:fluoride efflux transporter FluC n=1 Tax=unclassified Rossellomorea TaxID=2837526 RepID=UPI00262D5919|nr:CrcB family protein [uncultured Rossellomorea sp.]